jgi:hypothetical protein
VGGADVRDAARSGDRLATEAARLIISGLGRQRQLLVPHPVLPGSRIALVAPALVIVLGQRGSEQVPGGLAMGAGGFEANAAPQMRHMDGFKLQAVVEPEARRIAKGPTTDAGQKRGRQPRRPSDRHRSVGSVWSLRHLDIVALRHDRVARFNRRLGAIECRPDVPEFRSLFRIRKILDSPRDHIVELFGIPQAGAPGIRMRLACLARLSGSRL